ncbi:MAG: 50S ribosomal protein L24e [Thermoplasmata archaeon]|nr:50S ribosomal protein L24e [Thermoplasmata archaeon]
MVERRICSFCGNELEPGTGKLYIRKDGTIYHFCSNKCQKNLLKLKRVPRKVRWSRLYSKS